MFKILMPILKCSYIQKELFANTTLCICSLPWFLTSMMFLLRKFKCFKSVFQCFSCVAPKRQLSEPAFGFTTPEDGGKFTAVPNVLENDISCCLCIFKNFHSWFKSNWISNCPKINDKVLDLMLNKCCSSLFPYFLAYLSN